MNYILCTVLVNFILCTEQVNYILCTVQVNYVPDESSLTGGPLGNEYKLVQMHAHWGKVEGRGSEHTINGK